MLCSLFLFALCQMQSTQSTFSCFSWISCPPFRNHFTHSTCASALVSNVCSHINNKSATLIFIKLLSSKEEERDGRTNKLMFFLTVVSLKVDRMDRIAQHERCIFSCVSNLQSESIETITDSSLNFSIADGRKRSERRLQFRSKLRFITAYLVAFAVSFEMF